MTEITDNDIKKALECCSIEPISRDCGKCPFVYTDMGCSIRLSKDALDLINRQQAEIERLQKAIKVQDIMIEQQDYKLKQAKSEAIKEFWKETRELLEIEAKLYSLSEKDCEFAIPLNVALKTGDNLVKEMTEVKE